MHVEVAVYGGQRDEGGEGGGGTDIRVLSLCRDLRMWHFYVFTC